MKKRRKLPIILGVLLLVLLGLIIWRIPDAIEREKSVEVVQYIESVALTMSDVDGNNLPPSPDKNLNEATIEGVDVNENNIRDDVELAIFELYPNDKRIRAAELQYAMAMQVFLTNVFTEETWVAAADQTGRGYRCILSTLPSSTIEEGQERATEIYNLGRKRTGEVESLVLNTEKIRSHHHSIFEAFTTTYKASDKEDCDLNI